MASGSTTATDPAIAEMVKAFHRSLAKHQDMMRLLEHERRLQPSFRQRLRDRLGLAPRWVEVNPAYPRNIFFVRPARSLHRPRKVKGPPPPPLREVLRELQYLSNPSDLPRRIELWHTALRLLPREEDPFHWATFQFGLGCDLMLDPNTAEQAVQAYEAALDVFARKDFPREWAATLHNLGIAYTLIPGNDPDNFNFALQAFEAALTVRTRRANPAGWVMTQIQLAEAFLMRPSGNPAQNVEWAVEILHAVQAFLGRSRTVFLTLDEHDPAQPPVPVMAQAHHLLGKAYVMRRIGSDRKFEVAIEYLDAALAAFTRERHPSQWANIEEHLALALSQIKGRAENREKAIVALRSALAVHEQYPGSWAATQRMLGEMFRDRILGVPAENLEQSRRAFEAAIATASQNDFSLERAIAQVGLAATHLAALRGQGGDVELAIPLLEEALTVLTPSRQPEHWGLANHYLGIAHTVRAEGELDANQYRAAEAFRSALGVFDFWTLPQHWASTLVAVGELSLRWTGSDWLAMLEYSAERLRRAVEVLQTPLERRKVAFCLGRVEAARGRWPEAHAAFQTALEAAELLYAGGLTEEDKRGEIEENARLYQALVNACLRLDPPRSAEAFLYAEEGRARLLRDQLGALALPAPAGAPAELIEEERHLLDDWRRLEGEIRNASDGEERTRKVEQAATLRSRLEGLWDQLLSRHAAAGYVALRRGERLRWDDVQCWLDAQPRRTALVEFFTLGGRLVAFLLQGGDRAPRVVEIKVPPPRLAEIGRSFVDEVRHLGGRDLQPAAGAPSGNANLETLLGLLPLDEAWDQLRGVELLYFIPHGALHLLPLHACPCAGGPLIERFPIAYAPSAATLLRLAASRPAPSFLPQARRKILVVGDPLGDLPFARNEAIAVAELFAVEPLLGEQAIASRVRAELPEKVIAHFATHAVYETADPMASGICLARREVLSAREVMSRMLGVELMVLSGCETGVQDVRTGDELMGLARALLYSGVRSLIVSLWKVNDRATADLMLRFYGYLEEEGAGGQRRSRAEALQAAILGTRKEFPHSYSWAPFLLAGLP